MHDWLWLRAAWDAQKSGANRRAVRATEEVLYTPGQLERRPELRFRAARLPFLFGGRPGGAGPKIVTWDEPGSAFFPIYGRRRVGKSELIVQFLKDRPGVYHVGKEAPAADQQREFLDVAASALGEPLLAEVSPRGWKHVLQTVVGRWTGPGKLILALDEFQWTTGASGELPSVLQELWDREWKPRGDVFLILCGSYIGFMEREVLGSRSPLFGRRTGSIQLLPFDFREAREFHSGYSLVDSARTWFVCGGIPLYLRFFQQDRSVPWNIRRSLLDPYGPLFREADFLLREELRDVATYHAVLTRLSAGTGVAKDIASSAGVPSGSIGYYLDQLIGLGYVRRRYPLDGRPPKKRQVRFVLSDPLLRFWFRFVFPHLSLVTRLGPKGAYDRLVAPQLQAWCGERFEELCRDALPMLWDADAIDGVEVGEFWGKDVQIDVVGMRSDGRTDVGEVKWGEVSPAAVAAELDTRVRRFPNPDNHTIGRLVFAREGIEAARATELGVQWYGLEDIYGVE